MPPPGAGTGDPYIDSFGTFESLTVSGGVGLTVVPLPEGIRFALVSWVYTANTDAEAASVGVWAVDEHGRSNGALYIHSSGSFTGTGATLDNTHAGSSSGLEVISYGQWTLTVTPIASAVLFPLPTGGVGYTVFRYDGPLSGVEVSGGDQVLVWQHTSARTRPAGVTDESGRPERDVYLIAGPSIVVIQTSGPWTLSLT